MATSHKSLIPSILSMSMQPYGSGSKLATSHPGYEHFTDRTHFILFKNMTHLAVKLDVANMAYGNTRRRHSKKTFFINIHDLDDDITVSSRSVFIDMDADTMHASYRADISLLFSQIDPDKQYAVEVVIPDADSPGPVLARPLRFIQCTKPLPHRYYAPLRAGIQHSATNDPDIDVCDYYKEATVRIWDEDEFKVIFQLVDNITETIGFTPELFALVETDSTSRLLPVDISGPQEYDDGRTMREATVTIPKETETDSAGSMTVRIHLKSQGYTFATAAFHTVADRDLKGMLTADELVKTELDSPAKWIDHVCVRAIEWEKALHPAPTAMDELSAMVGLDEIKAKVMAYRQLMQFFDRRRKAGLATKYPALHSMFLGSPGTGKTTVAKIMGRVLKECGVLSSGHVVVKERASLIGQYYSSESENTRKALEEAHGGILFIDEAYQLMVPADPKDPGRWVIDSLMTALSDESDRDWMLILAGYTEPTQRLLDLNPGLASRIPATNIFHFKDFSADELMDIALGYFKSQEFVLTPNAEHKLRRKLEADHLRRGKDFGNGRHVLNLIESHILPAMAARLDNVDDCNAEMLSTIRSSDIPALDTEIQKSAPAPMRMGFVG